MIVHLPLERIENALNLKTTRRKLIPQLSCVNKEIV